MDLRLTDIYMNGSISQLGYLRWVCRVDNVEEARPAGLQSLLLNQAVFLPEVEFTSKRKANSCKYRTKLFICVLVRRHSFKMMLAWCATTRVTWQCTARAV